MTYTRIFSDETGESHFGDAKVELRLVDFAPPAPQVMMSSPVGTNRTLLAVIPAGFRGDWHNSPARQFYVQTAGELEVEVSDGERRRFRSGSVVLVEDTTGKGHVTSVIGDTDVQAVFIQLE